MAFFFSKKRSCTPSESSAVILPFLVAKNYKKKRFLYLSIQSSFFVVFTSDRSSLSSFFHGEMWPFSFILSDTYEAKGVGVGAAAPPVSNYSGKTPKIRAIKKRFSSNFFRQTGVPPSKSANFSGKQGCRPPQVGKFFGQTGALPPSRIVQRRIRVKITGDVLFLEKKIFF